jgi:hypothetical protein
VSTKPKKRPAPVPFVLQSAIRKATDRPLPSSPDLLCRIIEALVKRTSYVESRRSRTREEARIRVLLQMLAAIEQIQAKTPWPDGSALYLGDKSHLENEMPEVTLNAYSSFLLNELSRPNRSKRQHLLVTLHFQRHFILSFMAVHGYQNVADNRQEEWFENTYGEHFFSVLTAYPCFCPYPQTLREVLYPVRRDPFSERDPLSECDQKGKYLAPAGRTSNDLLANLHNTRPEQIRKLLKEPLAQGPPVLLT